MKANKEPEKVYISYVGYGVFGEDGSTERTNNSQTEYTRTDAFIEKACEFLFDEIYNKIEDKYIRNELMEDSYASKIIEDFKNYMKGE